MAELPQPDMSHLTPEERRIIEGVLMRQKEEEEQDHEIMRRKQDEVQILEETIRMRSEKHKKAGVELNATCHICLKTKFADGVGHICNYCDIRCCARCGGKVTLRSSKVIWVCILCRKKQELLSKTGQWMAKTGLGAVDSALLRQMQEDLQVGGRQGLADQTRDKRPKLERAHSAAEKENLPLLQRSGNCPLRRQYSQQEQISGRRMSTSDSGVEMSVSPHARTLPTPHVVSSYPVQQTPRHPAAYPDDDPNLYRGELDGLMRQHPPNYQRQRSTYQDSSADLGMTYGQTPMETGSVRTTVHPSQQHSLHQTQGVHPVQPTSTVGVSQQRSFSSSEEERSTPECASDEPDESEKGKGYYHHAGGPKSMSSGGRRHNGSHNGHHGSGAGMTAAEHNGHHPPREPRKEESTLVRRSFRRCGDEWRADSRRFTEKREKKTVRFDGGTNVGGPQEEEWSWEADRQGSQDSATKDSGIDTSSTFTSSEDSNRGDLPKHPSWQVSEDGQKIIGHMILRKSAGTGSCSSILGLKVVGGKLLEDGSMGALIEKVKKGSTADVEGHLRPGDEVIAWNGRSLQGKSFREVYDIIAESRLEPQIELVVERKLSSTTTGMAGLAGPGPSTPMASRRIVAQSQWRQKHETISGPPTPHHKELYDARREKPSVLVTSPGSPDLHAQGRGRHSRHPTGNANVGGSIQVKLGYDLVGLQLIVTIICASGLTPKSNGQPRNPYAKVFLLPDKSEKSKRRTKTVANTNDPRWNQTFVYNGVRRSELKKRALEITVWDYARYEANDFLGETVLELAVCLLDEEPEWHSLTAHGEHRHVRHYQDSEDMIDCHLSPPSTTSRLSDSDTSECDITDYDVSREQRRTADGASISSIGSSSRFHNMPSNYKRHYSSPPPERELYIDGEHRSRRDMSPQGRKRAALMISRDQPASISSYQTYRKDEFHRGMMGHRSHSAAPMDSPSVRYRGRSQSPTGHRSLSPPEHRSFPYSHGGYVHTTRFGSRSATATPTGSPKKRQLPQIPAALKERVAQDFEERARFMRHRNRQSIYRSTGMGGWEKHYSGLSDSDLPSIGRDPLTLSHSHAHRMHRSRRGHLSPDKDVLGGDLGDSDMESIASVTSSAFSTQSERPRGSRLMPGAVGLLSRRAKSFEYESISSNIFSDDSLRTARKKLKRNLSLSDAGYGDKIPALDDQSKSYYDSNGDDKVPTSLTSKETNYDFLLDRDDHKSFYGYDSELSCGETEIYVPSFDKQNIETDDYQVSYSSRLTGDNDLFSDNDRANLRNIRDKDDTSKRKYIDESYLNHDSSYIRDISSGTRTKNVDSDLRTSIDDIYSGIEEAFSSGKSYDRDILASSAAKIHDPTNIDVKGILRSRGATGRSYQESGYKARENWDTDYDEGFIDREKDYKQKQFKYLDEGISALRINRSMRKGEYFHDVTKDSCAVKGKCYAQSDDDNRKLTSDYISYYYSSDDSEYRTTYTDKMEMYEDGSVPRRRRRRSRRGSREGGASDYENLRTRNALDAQSRLTESRRSMTLQRTESTPTLHSDEDLSSIADRARRMYRRKRNSSCPESRDLRMHGPRGNGERMSNILLDSDEEFGSMETVIGADYFRRTSGYARANDGVRSGFFDAEQDRGSYLDARYDHEDRSYPTARGLVRSGSQRSSIREARHVSRTRRKSSCPECRELALSSSELGRSGSLSRKGDDSRRSSLDTKHRYRRRNSSCPEARDLEMLEKRQRQQQLMQLHQQQRRYPTEQYQQQQQQQQHQQPQGSSKRNVAISDTLEYYEYSMESESQCSENCGFGPCDPRRPRNRAPRPGNANSSLFDSQTATSDTAKNYHPRIDDHHHQHPQNTKTSPLANVADVASTFLPPLPPSSSSSSARRRTRKKSSYDVDVVAAAGADRRDDDDARNRRSSSMPESSEYTSQSSSYEKTSSHRQVTDNGHNDRDKRSQFTRSLSNADVPQDEKDTGSFSDTAIALNVEDAARRGRKSSPGSKSGSGSSSGSAVQYQAGGLGKKSNSTSQLSATECGGMIVSIGGSASAVARTAGLASRKRNSTPGSIQRSEEVMPAYQRFDNKLAGSAASDTAGSLNSISSSEGSSWSPSLRMAGEGQLRDFIEDLGPGQVVGRQALGARCLGEIQLSLSHTKGYLEVEVIRAKDLKAKQGSKVIPAPYVKLYLVNGKRCIEKAKTTMARKTLDPFYQQLLAFKENCRGCILQVTVWGDYGRIEGKKVFMGIAQIVLDELDLSQMVFGWYKLFDTQALVSGAASLALSRRSSVTSLDSFKI
ncbi:regulating synaptic membrane exocytosis protein 2 isoform X4 [Monomorium pharaonis]|uniref:regulating synaptic membrane exocytosis protein 2 isoform X4 n=1 Tax=Monomorium pharaonis TaxID=307658 RepID=UPI00102E1BE2|nr:regulating synaptic membrane exocytosis protein 2 isoform X4 [Monomorium pharaonis]